MTQLKNTLRAAILLLLTALYCNPFAFAQDTDWQYKKPVTVYENSGSGLSDYQVLLIVDTKTPISQGNMNPDGGDIRFAMDCEGGTPLAYWTERWLNTDSTEIWVKIPNIPASGSVTIWMFYGDVTAASRSSFDAVFPNVYTLKSGEFDLLQGPQYYDWFEVEVNSTVWVMGGVPLEIHARKIVMAGIIDADRTGYAGGDQTPLDGSGSGGGGLSTNAGGGGGGYGNFGGDGGGDGNDQPGAGGSSYGSPAGVSFDMGSGGGGTYTATGGAGGGAVWLDGKVLEISGIIYVDGGAGGTAGSPWWSAGGGAGGGILLSAYDIRNQSAYFFARGGAGGGDGSNDAGGGGAGGRIKMSYERAFTGMNLTWANGGAGGNGNNMQADGQPGSIGTTFSETWTCTEPSATIGAEMQAMDANFTTSGMAYVNDTVIFTNLSNSDIAWTYSWDFGSGASPLTASVENPESVVYSTEGSKTITLTITDNYGCADSASQTIMVYATPGVTVDEDSVWIPSAFTPDNNGKNDVLYVGAKNITDFEFSIFNRWGRTIYYSNNVYEGWDGKSRETGEAMPVGAYVYYVKGTDSEGDPVSMKGLVNLIR